MQETGRTDRPVAQTGTHSGTLGTGPEKRSHPMGDKKGKKDKAKGQRQKDAKDAKDAKKKRDKQQPRVP